MPRFAFPVAVAVVVGLAVVGLSGCGQPVTPVSAEEHYEGDGHDHSHHGDGHHEHDHDHEGEGHNH